MFVRVIDAIELVDVAILSLNGICMCSHANEAPLKDNCEQRTRLSIWLPLIPVDKQYSTTQTKRLNTRAQTQTQTLVLLCGGVRMTPLLLPLLLPPLWLRQPQVPLALLSLLLLLSMSSSL